MCVRECSGNQHLRKKGEQAWAEGEAGHSAVSVKTLANSTGSSEAQVAPHNVPSQVRRPGLSNPGSLIRSGPHQEGGLPLGEDSPQRAIH